MVTLVETLIGKGCDVGSSTGTSSMARLVGANRRYIEEEIPHIASLMCASAEALLAHAEVIVIGNPCEDATEVLAAAKPEHVIVDLTRGHATRAASRGCAGSLTACGPRPSGLGPRWRLLVDPSRRPPTRREDAADRSAAIGGRRHDGGRAVGPHRSPFRAGGDLQAALDERPAGRHRHASSPAPPIEDRSRCRGRSGSGWIVIRPPATPETPRPGTRVDPGPRRDNGEAHGGGGVGAGGADRAGRHHYRLVGLEIRPTDGAFLYDLVEIGAAETSADALPHHVIVERCYLHGDPRRGARRGVALNGAHAAVIDSHLADFKEVGADSPGDRRLERPRAVQDREQLPRGRRRERDVRGRRSVDPRSRAVRHRDPAQPHPQAAGLEAGRPDVRGQRVDA